MKRKYNDVGEIIIVPGIYIENTINRCIEIWTFTLSVPLDISRESRVFLRGGKFLKSTPVYIIKMSIQ